MCSPQHHGSASTRARHLHRTGWFAFAVCTIYQTRKMHNQGTILLQASHKNTASNIQIGKTEHEIGKFPPCTSDGGSVCGENGARQPEIRRQSDRRIIRAGQMQVTDKGWDKEVKACGGVQRDCIIPALRRERRPIQGHRSKSVILLSRW